MTNHTRGAARVVGLLAALLAPLLLVAGPVRADAPIATTTTVDLLGGEVPSSTSRGWYFGDLATAVATVTAAAGTPTGTVSFHDDHGAPFRDDAGNVIGVDVPVAADGTASFTFRVSPENTDVIEADFTGSGGYAPSTGQFGYWRGSGTVVVVPRKSTLRLTPDLRSVEVRMSAVLRRRDGSPLPHERVVFTVVNPPPMGPGGPVRAYQTVCEAITDDAGFAGCGNVLAGSYLVPLLLGSSYASHLPTGYYGGATARVSFSLLG